MGKRLLTIWLSLLASGRMWAQECGMLQSGR